MTNDWKTAMADVTWNGVDEFLDGEQWPDEIVLRAWKRNDLGERRITAQRRYVLVEDE